MSRYEVIESMHWKRDDGATASVYGAVPWTSSREEPRWQIVKRGYTVRDNVSGTVGIGRVPWPTRAEAEAWVNARNAEHAERHRMRAFTAPAPAPKPRRKKKSSPPKKSQAQVDRENAAFIADKLRRDLRELSPIALTTELRNANTMQRMRPTEQRQRYVEKLENELREREERTR